MYQLHGHVVGGVEQEIGDEDGKQETGDGWPCDSTVGQEGEIQKIECDGHYEAWLRVVF